MGNASRALLIAAAVLIGILIITVSLRIFNSTNGVEESANEVGGEISTQMSEAAYELISEAENNLVRIKEHKVNIVEFYYDINVLDDDPKTKVLLEPNTEYELSFDYKINKAQHDVSCGIGCGKGTYKKDITEVRYYKVNSPNTEGRALIKFNTKNKLTIAEPYLQIRFARMSAKGSLDVDISNVIFKKVE